MNTKKDKITDFLTGSNPGLTGNLAELLYAMSELGLWPDAVDSVSVEQALLIWRIVEKMRILDFPDDLFV